MPPYDVRVREHREQDAKEITTGVLFVTNSGRSATEALKRLLNDEPPPDHRLAGHRPRAPAAEDGRARGRVLPRPGEAGQGLLRAHQARFRAVRRARRARGRRGPGPRGGRRDRVAPGDDPPRQRGRGGRLEPPQGPLPPPPAAPSPAVRGASDPPDPTDSRIYLDETARPAVRHGPAFLAAGDVREGSDPGIHRHAAGHENPLRGSLRAGQAIANQMHIDKLIHATPNENDLFLQCRT